MLAAPIAMSSRLGSMRPPCCTGELVGRTDRLGEGHQGDADRADEQQGQGLETDAREGRRRQASRQVAHDVDAGCLQPEHGRDGDGGQQDHQRGRQARQPVLQEEHPGDAGEAHRQREEVGVTELRDDVTQQLDGGLAMRLDAQQLGDLLDGDEQRQAEDEAEQHGLREELRDAPELERAGRDRDEAGQDGQGRGQGHELGAALDGDLADGRSGHDGDGRRDGHHQLARATQRCVREQGRRGRVEGVFGRHPGQLGVGHALRDEDGADGQAGDDVEGQPARLVALQPGEDGPGPTRRAGLPVSGHEHS